jgi:hypothetical protein
LLVIYSQKLYDLHREWVGAHHFLKGPHMPFTLSHPAIVIPLKWWAPHLTSLPALVIGSMAPDFVYFFPFGISASFTHSWLGVFLYCVPTGVLLYIFYYALLRDAFIEWAPQQIAARMQPHVAWLFQDVRSVSIVLTSLAIGASSHNVWDEFTHLNTSAVYHLEVLRMRVQFGSFKVPAYKLLQHLSTVVGFIVIAGSIYYCFSSAKPIYATSRRLSTKQRLIVSIVIFVAAATAGIASVLLRGAVSIEHVLFNFVVNAMTAAALAIVCLCVVWKIASVARDRTIQK